MNKNAYFFLVDAIIALFILSLGIVLAYSYVNSQPSDDQVSLFSIGTMKFLFSTPLYDIDSQIYDYDNSLHSSGNITNINYTIAEQIGEFYYRIHGEGCSFCEDILDDFLENVSTIYLSEEVSGQYSMMMIMNHTVIYNRSIVPPDESRVLIPSKKIIFGAYDGSLWGPYPFEVWVWK